MRANSRNMPYLVFTIVLCIIFAATYNSSWEGSGELHTNMEVVATLVAMIVGLVAMVRFYSKKQSSILFIAVGFFGTAFLDGYHAVVTSTFFREVFPSPIESLIPWSWNASRTFLSILMVLSWWVWRREQRLGKAQAISENTVYVVVGTLTLISFWFFAFVRLPRAYLTSEEFIFGRPQEFVAAVFFLVALIGYLRKRRQEQDVFENYLIYSLLIGVISQSLFMSRSYGLFDAMFDMAHFLKIVSYCFVLTGLLISMYGLFIQAGQAAEAEIEAREAQVRERVAREQTDKLEIANQELERSRAATLEMMQEIENARHRLAEQADELEKSNTALLRSNNDLDDFAYIASHDLKEPLRGIDNYATFLMEDYGDKLDDEGREKIQTLKRLCLRSRDLIDSLLQFSRVGRADLAIQETDLHELLSEIIDSMHVTLDEQKVEIRTPQNLPRVTCDRVRVGEVFRNLITNAYKYNESEQKWVEIGFDSDQPLPGESPGKTKDKLVFRVRDNGIGIRENHLDSIFRIFKRLHSREKYGGGTGAGLTFVKKIVERHGGRIWVESEYGEGTTFYFTLN